MYGKKLSVYAKRMNTQDRSGSDFNKKNNGHERHKHEQLIEQNQQRVIFEQHVFAL